MTSRTVDLVVFGVCAGVTGVWSFVSLERLYYFLMFIGLVAYMRSRPPSRPITRGNDPAAIRRIGAVFYAQGLQHGKAQARAEARIMKGGDSQHLPEAG